VFVQLQWRPGVWLALVKSRVAHTTRGIRGTSTADPFGLRRLASDEYPAGQSPLGCKPGCETEETLG
jgi:hypothetical protein